MRAEQGDLLDPQADLFGSEWQDFDAAITSMALHHMRDPGKLLARLVGCVRSGGSVVVVDFICPTRDGGGVDLGEFAGRREVDGFLERADDEVLGGGGM